MLVTLTAVSVWLLVRGSLPTVDGELIADGLTAPATIERDAAGVATITAANRTDLAYATGFAHAQDRFFQMDLIRRQAAGELSELFGGAAQWVDRSYRFHRFRARAQRVIAGLPASDRKILESYADGVNAGLDSLSVRPFEYLLLRVEPAEWRAEDSLLAVYSMFMTLNDDRARKDVRRGLAKLSLDPTLYAWLYPDGTPWDAPIVGEARQPLPVPDASVLSLRNHDLRPEAPDEPQLMPGSNNWAVGGALTEDGRALVSNDMHLGHSVPNIWYRARLITNSDGRDLTGVTLPGTPIVVAGSNGRIAWGYTNSYGDWSDAVIVRETDGGLYRTPDGDEPFEFFEELIRVKGGDDIQYTVRETRWGPVDDEVTFDGSPIAVRWLAHSPDAVNLRILDLETTDSVDAALDIANTMGLPPQNFVVGDSDGNIAWTVAGKIPEKSDYDPMVPVDFSEEGGWLGFVAPDRYPRVVNPQIGRLWTANARVVDGDMLSMIGDGGYDLGARARQIRDGLLARDRFTPTDMLAIQRDSRAIFLSPWRDRLMSALTDEGIAGRDALIEARGILDDWVADAVPESRGYRLVRAFRLEFRRTLFDALTHDATSSDDDAPRPLMSNQFEAPAWQLLNEEPQHLLPAGYDDWDALILDTLERSIDRITDGDPAKLGDAVWGEVNTARIRHPLSQAVPQLSDWLDMPAEPLPGDANLPLAQGPSFGASERFSVSPGNEENGIMHMPTGQSGHPLSPYYRAGHADWVSGRPAPFLPGKTEHTLTLATSK